VVWFSHTAQPKPLASDPFMILSLLQEVTNMLYKKSTVSVRLRSTHDDETQTKAEGSERKEKERERCHVM